VSNLTVSRASARSRVASVVDSRAVAAASDSLEQIIRDELRDPVSELVRQVVVELVHEQLNGNAPPVETPAVNGVAPATKVCKTCARELPLDRFAPNRHECKSCRNARYPRNRRARGTAKASPAVMAVDEEPPRTGAAESGSEA
jgi:hypothetical protein